MASRFDKFVTGPVPRSVEPHNEMFLFSKTREAAARTTPGSHQYGPIPQEVLLSTSTLLTNKLKAGKDYITIVWKEPWIVDVYLAWVQHRIIYRIDCEKNRLTFTLAHSLLKFPPHPLKEYSPCVRDIHGLINMWLFGAYMQDETFMDTVLDMLQKLLEEQHADDYNDGTPARKTFLKFANAPPVIEAIWSNTTPTAQLRAFVIDQILLHASEEYIHAFYTAKAAPPAPLSFKGPPKKVSYKKASPNKAAASPAPTPPSTPTRQTRKRAAESDSPVTPIRPTRKRAAESDSPSQPHTPSPEVEVEVETSPKDAYPAAFLDELRTAHRDTLLVSRLPEDLRHAYRDQLRVFLPPPPYDPELVFGHTVQSVEEMNQTEHQEFLRNVYGGGKMVGRGMRATLEEWGRRGEKLQV